MAQKGKVQVEVQVVKDKAQKDIKDFSTSAKSQFGGIADAAKGFMAGAVVAAIGKAVEALIDFGKEAAKFKGIQDSFKSIATSMGQDSEALMNKMRAGTKGMISDLELMKNANIAMSKGLDMTQVEEMSRIAMAASKATGQSMNDSFAMVLDGLAEQKGKILEQVGMSFDAAKALDVYAASIGKTAAQLTIAEKNQGFLTAALKVGGAMADTVGSSNMLTFGQYLEKISAQMDNAGIKIKQTLLPAMTALADSFSSFLEDEAKLTTESDLDSYTKLWISVGKAVIYVGSILKSMWNGMKGDNAKAQADLEKLVLLYERFKISVGEQRSTRFGSFSKEEAEAKWVQRWEQVTREGEEAVNRITDNVHASWTDTAEKAADEYERKALAIANAPPQASIPPPGTRPGDQNTNVAPSSSGKTEEKKFGMDIGKEVGGAIDAASGMPGLGGGVVGVVGMAVEGAINTYTTMLQAEAQFLAVRSEKINYFADLFVGLAQKQKEKELQLLQEKWDAILQKEQEGYDAMNLQIEDNMAKQFEDINSAYNNQTITTEEKEAKIVQAQKFAQEQKDRNTKDHNKRQAENEKQKNAEMKRLDEERKAQEDSLRRARAMVTWVTSSAQLEAQKRIQMAQVTITAASSAAQAIGMSVAMLGPILGGAVGVGLAANIIAAANMSRVAIASQIALPPSDLFLAEGGVVMPRPGGVQATIAEAGVAEAVIPLDKMGGMGGVTINVQNLYATEDLPAKLVDMIDRELYMRARVGQSVFAAEVGR